MPETILCVSTSRPPILLEYKGVGTVVRLVAILLAAFALVPASCGLAYGFGDLESVDTAIVFAIDTSSSIDAEHFSLQIKSIASVFRDKEVRSTMESGLNGAVLVTLVQWSTHAFVSVPWTRISSESQAEAFAEKVTKAPRIHDYVDFTCLAVALRGIETQVLPTQPEPALRTIIDVSGNGIDNCSLPESGKEIRDELVAAGATINGLPILEGAESVMLETWYRDHVIGGAGAFLIAAQSFADMARAMRKKFILEISMSH